jgi:hypothetical protein
VSLQAMEHPTNTTLAGEVETLFKGTTLRGMLLNAYGFWQMGQIALIGAIVSFIAAGLFLILSIIGFAHLLRTAPESEIFPRFAHKAKVATV